MPLYRTQSPYQAAVGALGNASQTASSMTKKTETKYNEPSKSLGGAIAAGLGGAIGGLGVVEQFDQDAGKQLYQKIMGSMFGTPENAAGALAGDLAMANTAQAVGDTLSLTSTLPAAQSLTTGGAAMTGGALGAEAAGLAGTSGLLGSGAGIAGAGSLSSMAGRGTGALATDLGISGGLAATDLSLSGATGLGTSASMAEGAKLGAAGGWTGAALGAGLGLTLGLASYFF